MRRIILLEIAEHLLNVRVEACRQPTLKTAVLFLGLHLSFQLSQNATPSSIIMTRNSSLQDAEPKYFL